MIYQADDIELSKVGDNNELIPFANSLHFINQKMSNTSLPIKIVSSNIDLNCDDLKNNLLNLK